MVSLRFVSEQHGVSIKLEPDATTVLINTNVDPEKIAIKNIHRIKKDTLTGIDTS